LNRIARTLVELVLRRIRSGTVVVQEDGRCRTYGRGGPTATITVHSRAAWRQMLRGSLGLADSYVERAWDSPGLVALIRVAARNAALTDRLRIKLLPLTRPVRAAQSFIRPSTRHRRRRDIAAHYDLGEDLFSRMLDSTMTYSCAVYERPGSSLQEAQLAKLERICERLSLSSRDRVLEIGTGWGAFAIYAAQTRGCRVTTTTISRDQYAYATTQVRRAGLSGRVRLLCQDYRDLRGRYDKLVSIEMIEAVGWRHTSGFLRACSRLLDPAGAMLLQAITIDDRAYEIEKATPSFMNQRIFPGGSLPSMEVLKNELVHDTDLALVSVDDITTHYVTTLKAWRERFAAHAQELAALGYDERFQRLWMLYLAYCEAGFAERRIQDVQLLLAKPECRLRGGTVDASDPLAPHAHATGFA
jgi:cyclopropane-fatty-acyl-phospholipid synthase